MVYSNKFVVCVLFNGEPQPELANGVVKLPFNSEYELRFRNKNDRKAVVKIFIDGENVSGNGYIINPNSFIDIKRHHDIDRSFKFVSLDSPDAVDHGKNGPNQDKVKGTIEAKFYLEKQVEFLSNKILNNMPKPLPSPKKHWIDFRQYNCDQDALRSRRISSSKYEPNNQLGYFDYEMSNPSSCSDDSHQSLGFLSPSKVLKDGCTVEGNLTGQTFGKSHVETESSCTSIKVFLQGYDLPVKKPMVENQPIETGEHFNPAQESMFKELGYSNLQIENEKLRQRIEDERENIRLKQELQELLNLKNESNPKQPKRTRMRNRSKR